MSLPAAHRRNQQAVVKMVEAKGLSLRGGRRPTWQSHATAYGFAEAALLSDRVLQDCHVASLLAMTHQGGAAVHQCSCAVELP